MIGTSSSSSLLAFDDLRLTCHAWFPNPLFAQVLFDASKAPPTAAQLDRLGDFLRARGFQGAITGAVHPSEQASYEQAGYHTREDLHVLRLDKPGRVNKAGGAKTQRYRRQDISSAVRLDNVSFEPDWRLNEQGFADARHATPRSRFRVVRNSGEVIGYAITGRSGQAGYLQRLATHPEVRNRGIGKSLALDAVNWCARWKVKSVFVNTQLHNDTAMHLYQNLGFELLEHRLKIMQVTW